MPRRALDATLVADLWFFRVSAAAQSFRRAAERLAVTQSAVSQRIQRLEARLGVVLFARGARALRLTAQGRLLFEQTAEAFDAIAIGVANLRDRDRTAALKVSCVPSLALEWLTPRMARFLSTEPAVTVAVYGETHDLDLALCVEEGVDVVIRYGPRRDTSLYLAFELEETIFPVAAPAFLADLPARQSRGEPVTLLHDASPWPDAPPTAEWDLWLTTHRWPWSSPRQDQFFNLAQLAYRAAIAGAGVAVGRSLVVARHLEEGRLVAATELLPLPTMAYRILAPSSPTTGSPAERFISWLAAELKVSDAINVMSHLLVKIAVPPQTD